MVGDRNTAEWSDDDAVKSGSNTEGDVGDDLPPTKKGEKKKFKTPITTLNMKRDPISTILNKIDAEISSLSRSQSSVGTGSTVIHRPSSASRSPIRHEDELTRSQLDKPGPLKATHTYDNSYSSKGRESPLLNGGYASKGRESPLLNGDVRINGVAEKYADSIDSHDSKRKKGTSDLDSVSAHDVDEKFKQILRKRSGYPETSRNGHPSDKDTSKPEDFNRNFQDSLAFSSDETTEYKSDADESSSDSEKTVKGEDSLLWDYFDTVPKSASGFKEEERQSFNDTNSNRQENGELNDQSFIDRVRPKRSKSSPPVYNKLTNNQHLLSYQSLRKPTYVSDAESVRTEDFEFRFKDLIVNQMDSETDATDNDPLHAKVKEILQVTLPYRKTDRGRTQSENNLHLKDRKIEMLNGDTQLSSRETDTRSRDRHKELVNGDIQRSPRDTDRLVDGRKDFINGDGHPSHRDIDNRMRERRKDTENGPSPREPNKRRNSESVDYKQNPVSSSESYRSKDHAGFSSTFDETESLTSTSHESKFSRQSSFDGYNPPMSGRSSLSATSGLSSLSRSPSQDENLSTASSWSSLYASGDGAEPYQLNLQYSPLLEKLYEDAQSLNLLPRQNLPLDLDSHSSSNGSSRRDLIIPDEESQEIPFAKYTFNKKPESHGSPSLSEKSSSSKDSRDSFDKVTKRDKYLHSFSKDSYMSSSLSSSSHFDSDNMSSILNSEREKRLLKQMSSQWLSMNMSNDRGIYPPSFAHGYPQQFSFPIPPQQSSVYFPQMPVQPPQDPMLLNLGYDEDIESFLPARFAQDWKKKIMKQKQEMYIKAQQQMFYHTIGNVVHNNEQFCNQFAEQLSFAPPEAEPRKRTSNTSKGGSNMKNSDSLNNNVNQNEQVDDGRAAAERQSSIEKLRDLLKSDSVISSVNTDKSAIEKLKLRETVNKEKAMDAKRKQFARARQKSLPIYLETLSEEDECSSVKSFLSRAKSRIESHSDDSTKSQSENSSICSSNPGSISEANFADTDISEYKLANFSASLDKTCPDNILKPIEEKAVHFIPSIFVEQGVSNESLEIDEILCSSNNENYNLHVEPAMVSVVLNDVDSKPQSFKNLSHLTPHYHSGEADDKFLRRRSSSSISISPMPLSPVTVIEVGLDNQNDSLDIVSDSIEHDDCFHGNRTDMSIAEFSNSLEEKINQSSYDAQKVTDLLELKLDTTNGNSKPYNGTFVSHIEHISPTNSLSIEIPTFENHDQCIQADDGSLSPIVSFSAYESLFQKLANNEDNNMFYLAKHCGTQYEAQSESESFDSDKVRSFFDNLPNAASSRHNSIVNENSNLQKIQNMLANNKEIKNSELENIFTDVSIQTEDEMNDAKIIETKDNSTSTNRYITCCRCSNYPSLSQSDSDSSTKSDIQTTLQATIERLEKKTRKYRALYCKD